MVAGDRSFAELLQAQFTGPAACGWLDQCWTLARIAEIVRCRFGVDYALAGLHLLLDRHRLECAGSGAQGQQPEDHRPPF